MKIIIPGGSGQVGTILARHFSGDPDNDVVVLTRKIPNRDSCKWRQVRWDAKTIGSWQSEFESADVVINLAGKSVDCRYTHENRRIIKQSRVDSVNTVGGAIEACSVPPRVWLQASTATIYQHTLEGPANGETDGIPGGNEPGVPDTWRFSIDVAKSWEAATDTFELPETRVVKMRAAMIMSPDAGGVFDILLVLVRKRLGGPIAGGQQFMSWIHDQDFVRAVERLIDAQSLSGNVNIAAPNPIPQREFMQTMRDAAGIRIGLPATRWMLEIGTWLMRSESELVLKSRKVVPEKLLDCGFEFEYPKWKNAATELFGRWKEC